MEWSYSMRPMKGLSILYGVIFLTNVGHTARTNETAHWEAQGVRFIAFMRVIVWRLWSCPLHWNWKSSASISWLSLLWRWKGEHIQLRSINHWHPKKTIWYFLYCVTKAYIYIELIGELNNLNRLIWRYARRHSRISYRLGRHWGNIVDPKGKIPNPSHER